LSGHKREENISVTPGNEPVYFVNLSEYLQYSRKETFTQKADHDKLSYLGMAHVLNFRPNTMTVGFDPKAIHLEFVVDKLVPRQVLIVNFEFCCKYCLNIHETRIFLSVYKEISENPNTYK